MKRVVLVVAVAAALLSGLAALNARSAANNNEQQKKRIIKQLEASPAAPVYADNSHGSQLYIQEASAKEILGDDFKVLAGEAPRHFKQTTYPEVTVLNTSGKTIKSFAVVVKSAVEDPKSGHFLLKKNLGIAPNATLKVTPREWPQAERATMQKEGQFINSLRQPGLDSAKSWIPGAASDLKVIVTFVEFEDGTKWIIPPE